MVFYTSLNHSSDTYTSSMHFNFAVFFHSIKVMNTKYMPGQTWVLQSLDFEDSPVQFFPEPTGEGFVHVRLLVWRPPPQTSVQLEYSPHTLHPPLT